MFTIDYSQAKEFGSIKDGTYEVTIDLAKQDATQGGADYLDIRFRIRKDFQQEFQNNIIFYRIFAKKEDGKYPVASIMNLAKASGIPDGTKFSSLDENLNVKRLEVTDIPLPEVNTEISEIDLPF